MDFTRRPQGRATALDVGDGPVKWKLDSSLQRDLRARPDSRKHVRVDLPRRGEDDAAADSRVLGVRYISDLGGFTFCGGYTLAGRR
jgi:hypothetical protein